MKSIIPDANYLGGRSRFLVLIKAAQQDSRDMASFTSCNLVGETRRKQTRYFTSRDIFPWNDKDSRIDSRRTTTMAIAKHRILPTLLHSMIGPFIPGLSPIHPCGVNAYLVWISLCHGREPWACRFSRRRQAPRTYLYFPLTVCSDQLWKSQRRSDVKLSLRAASLRS